MSISVKALTKTYGTQQAVDSINFDIKAGEIVGFLGPNGAGKSTTMKMLTGYVKPSLGSASICGLDVQENSKKIKEQIGYLPEHNPLYLDMYVKEYLAFMAKISGIRKDLKNKVDKSIFLTGLEREKNKKINALSKGYRQRIGLAQALIHEPKVLILDEPTSGLDPNQIVEIRSLIKAIGKERTVLLSTHIMQEVEAMCDRVLIIHNGKLVLDENLKNLYKSNGQQCVLVTFKNSVNKDFIKSELALSKVLDKGENQYLVFSTAKNDLQEQLFNFAVNQNNIIIEQKKQSQSLEHIFRTMTND